MARSRADEVLESWKIVARSAVRPAPAPRPRRIRSAIPVGMLAAAAVVMVVVVVVALSSRGIGPGPQSSLPAVGGNPTPEVTIAPSPSAPVMVSPSPSPPPTLPAQTPASAEVSAAEDAIDRYTTALVRRDYRTAYGMLAPESQAHWQSLANFTYDRSAYFKSVGGRYIIQVWPTGFAPITDWLDATYGASIDLRHAVLIKVDYPALAGNNAGFDLYIVNLGAKGLEIFDVR